MLEHISDKKTISKRYFALGGGGGRVAFSFAIPLQNTEKVSVISPEASSVYVNILVEYIVSQIVGSVVFLYGFNLATEC